MKERHRALSAFIPGLGKPLSDLVYAVMTTMAAINVHEIVILRTSLPCYSLCLSTMKGERLPPHSSNWTGKEHFLIQSRLEKEVMSMSDYELLMVVLTLIGILVAMSKR